MSSAALEVEKGGYPAQRVRGSDLRVQPLGVVDLGQHKHEDEAGEGGRPGHPWALLLLLGMWLDRSQSACSLLLP